MIHKINRHLHVFEGEQAKEKIGYFSLLRRNKYYLNTPFLFLCLDVSNLNISQYLTLLHLYLPKYPRVSFYPKEDSLSIPIFLQLSYLLSLFHAFLRLLHQYVPKQLRVFLYVTSKRISLFYAFVSIPSFSYSLFFYLLPLFYTPSLITT